VIIIVKYTEIHKSIVDRIKTKYPDIVFSTDVEKAITRPSFFVDLDNINSNDFMLEARDTNITARIYYFSSTINDNKIELLKMMDDLMEIFLDNNLVTIEENMKYEIEELELDVVDKVLHCYFDIKISEDYDRSKYDKDKPFMEELEVDNL